MLTQDNVCRRLIYILSLSTVVFLLPAWGQTHPDPEIDIGGFVREAKFIFKGRVTNIEYRNSEPVPLTDPNTGEQIFDSNGNPLYEDGTNIPHTFVTFQIEQVYKKSRSQAEDELTLRLLGGQSQSDTSEYLMVSDIPLFDVNDRDILFVTGNTESSCPLYRWLSGRFRILNDPNDPNEPEVKKIFNEFGLEVIYVPDVTGDPNEVALGPLHSLVEINTHDMGEFILKKVTVDEENEFDLPGANDVPEVGVPKGPQFTEVEFGTYLTEIVQEECGGTPPDQCGSDVVSADACDPFDAIAFPVAEPNIIIREEVVHPRPWLDELPAEQRAAILETERLELEMLRLTGGNPVLPETPCEISTLVYGAMPGDVSGPQGKRDCQVDLFDVAAVADNWLKSVEPEILILSPCLVE